VSFDKVTFLLAPFFFHLSLPLFAGLPLLPFDSAFAKE